MYDKILLPLDGSELAECAIPHMEAIARGCHAVDIVLLRVVEPLNLPGDYVISHKDRQRIEKEHRSAAEDYLRRMLSRLGNGGVGLHSEVVEGRVADTIVEYAENNRVDLIVMATHGRSGVSRWSLGSVADRVLRQARVPVLMVRAPGCAPEI